MLSHHHLIHHGLRNMDVKSAGVVDMSVRESLMNCSISETRGAVGVPNRS